MKTLTPTNLSRTLLFLQVESYRKIDHPSYEERCIPYDYSFSIEGLTPIEDYAQPDLLVDCLEEVQLCIRKDFSRAESYRFPFSVVKGELSTREDKDTSCDTQHEFIGEFINETQIRFTDFYPDWKTKGF